MFTRKKVITHLFLWIFVAVGIFLSFSFISPGLVFKKAFNGWLAILPLAIFLTYHVISSFYYHCHFHPHVGDEKRIIRAGVYGKCLHPTCTSLVILGWMLFFYLPDFKMLVSAIWATAVIFFWIIIEKSFFMGKKSRVEKKEMEPA